MTNRILKTETGVSVSHCVMVQCPPLAKRPHLKIKEQKFSEKLLFRLKKTQKKKTFRKTQKQCQILRKGYYIMEPIYINPSLAFILHGNKNTLGAEINPETVFLKCSKLEVTIQK